jgi:small multidrug resistance pump
MLLLTLAILSEVIGTTALKASEGFSRPLPSVIVVIGYAAAFYLFSLSIQHLPLGVAYAIWSGMGTVGAVVMGMLLWHEVLDVPRVLGILFILVGVILLNVVTPSSAG